MSVYLTSKQQLFDQSIRNVRIGKSVDFIAIINKAFKQNYLRFGT